VANGLAHGLSDVIADRRASTASPISQPIIAQDCHAGLHERRCGLRSIALSMHV